MNIIFNNIKIENFLSIGSINYVFDGAGFILVSGRNTNVVDNADSNGAGKSALFDAIIWVLTGDTIRGTKDVVNIFGNDGAYVELNFNVDNNSYTLIRTKDHSKFKTNLKLFVNGDDISGKGIRDTAKILDNTLPDITSNLIGSVILLGQGLPQRFTNNTPSGRKELLEKLSKSDFMIDDLKGRVSNHKSELTARLNSNINNRSVNERLQNEYEVKLNTLINELNTTCSDDNLSVLKNKLTEAEAKLQRLNDEHDKKVAEFTDINNDFVSVNFDYTAMTSKYNDNKSIIDSDFNAYKSNFRANKYQLDSEIKNVSSKILEIENMSDTCPTCGQKLINFIKPDTTELENELNNLKVELESLIAESVGVEQEYNTKIADLKKEYDDSIKSVKDKLSVIRNLFDTYNNDIKNIANQISTCANVEIAKLKSDVMRIEDLRAHINSDIAEHSSKIEKIQTENLYISNDIEDLTLRLDIVSNMETMLKRDFRGILLLDVINYIDKKCKDYSNIIFNTDLISFNLDGNDVNISYNGKLYENLSGGEKQKIDLIVQFAIRDMLSKQLNFSSNVLVVDEIFDNLDSIGCEKVLELINKELSDIENLFIITHHASISIPYDKEILVLKGEDNISSINVV